MCLVRLYLSNCPLASPAVLGRILHLYCEGGTRETLLYIQKDGECGFKKRKFCLCWVTPQMPAINRAGPSQRQEAGGQLRPSTGVAGTQALEHHVLHPREHISRKLHREWKQDFQLTCSHPSQILQYPIPQCLPWPMVLC